MQLPGCKHPQVPQKEKTRCNHRAASIFKCHRKKSKMQSPSCKHLQVPQKEKQDAITGLQASSSAIERKSKMQSSGGKHPQVPQKEKQDAITGLQASSSAIERKTRYTNQAASILKCSKKKNKIQSPGCKHPQVPQKEKQDTIAYQGSSSKYGKYKLRMRLFIVDRNKSSAYELTM